MSFTIHALDDIVSLLAEKKWTKKDESRDDAQQPMPITELCQEAVIEN